MPYITASIILQLLTVVVPVAGEAPEGGRGRPAEDHPVHALPDRRRWPSRSRSATSSSSARSRTQRRDQRRRRASRSRKLFLIVISLTAGCDAADVAGRADHPARHRQRDLADDLRLDRLAASRTGISGLVDQPRPGLRGDDAVHRAGGDRRRSSSSRRASGGSRSSTPSAWSAGG